MGFIETYRKVCKHFGNLECPDYTVQDTFWTETPGHLMFMDQWIKESIVINFITTFWLGFLPKGYSLERSAHTGFWLITDAYHKPATGSSYPQPYEALAEFFLAQPSGANYG